MLSACVMSWRLQKSQHSRVAAAKQPKDLATCLREHRPPGNREVCSVAYSILPGASSAEKKTGFSEV